uniref:Late embryogenesis abundant protein LEA-2 subgroup domain-containing protein n=2 Tax=Aegilops tauschii TaxID=37682 RepID=A0A453Q5Q3_AEGTS
MAATVNRGGPPDYDSPGFILCTILAVAAAILLVAGIGCLLYYGPAYPYYYVAIDSASGLLDVAAPDLTLNPEFNLTVRVTSASPGQGVCIEAGTYVEVSYRCVMLAASTATSETLCTEPAKSREVPFIARGVGVRVPGYMIDNLAGDVRNGVHVFDVTIKQSDAFYVNRKVKSCGGRRVGGQTADELEIACDGVWLCPDPDHRRIPSLNSRTKHISAQRIVM